MSDGYWIWSNNLIHEVETHDVRLPEEFAQHIRRQDYSITPPEVAEEDEESLIQSLDWSMRGWSMRGRPPTAPSS